MSTNQHVLALITDGFGSEGGIAHYNRTFIRALSAMDSINSVTVLQRTGIVGAASPVGAAFSRDSARTDAASVGAASPVGAASCRESTSDCPQNVTLAGVHSSRLTYATHAIGLAMRTRPDIIFCGHLFKAPLAVLLGRLLGIPVWLQLHGIDAWTRPSHLRAWAGENADVVLAVSRHTRRKFLSWARRDPATVRVLPNAVDDRFSPGPKDPELVARYGLEGKRVLLTVGRLSSTERYKGHDRVLNAMPELLRQFQNLVYLIAGDGDDRQRLETRVVETELTEQVRFLGHVAEADLPAFYRLADIFVMPSTGEGFGVVFLEALASGVPVIGARNDGSQDALRDGLAGTMIDPDSAEALALAITQVLSTPPGVSRNPFTTQAASGYLADLWSQLIPQHG